MGYYIDKIREREKKHEWYEKNKEKVKEKAKHDRQKKVDYILEFKTSRPCMDCRKSFPYYQLDFDHVRGKKRFNIAEGPRLGFSIDVIKTEMKKCDVVCKNCHAERGHRRRYGIR